MDKRDELLQHLTPTLMVPRFGQFEPLQNPGHRFLMASDGLWLEINRAWLYARTQCAPLLGQVPVPYGTVTPCVELRCGRIAPAILEQFVVMARAALPNETAAAVIWNDETGAMHLQPRKELHASAAHVTVEAVSLAEHEHLVMDLHSHARYPAGFSNEDNIYDRAGVYAAGVVGNVDQEHPTYAFRLCLLGLFLSM